MYIGATSLIQGAIPRILTKDIDSIEYKSIVKFKIEYNSILRDNVSLCKQLLKDIEALSIIEPHGTIYMMIKINLKLFNPLLISNDQEFAMKLLQEENLFLLPGQCFNMDGFIRLVVHYTYVYGILYICKYIVYIWYIYTYKYIIYVL